MTKGGELLVQTCDGSLVPCVIVDALGLLEVLVVLVESVVGQVDVVVFEALGSLGHSYRVVGPSGEPDQALSVDVNCEGVAARDQNVDSHVKFEPINQQRIINVLLDDRYVSLRDLFQLCCQENTLALTLAVRFHYHWEPCWQTTWLLFDPGLVRKFVIG